ncbi:heavy-metal-associated domain-containing protein [Rhodocytophaga aerolata]|uniref:Heavy-metal-associated domain-containing protein n=1 Tax=Rhodocytophaga aerolata TaxID=455078 RepID=A0ABT8RDD2_9BACT|nr:heavy-metal-associated domain-containing protein [Rhodocytophaga aerolata]MDO1449218.1 heavy-metal-associated domain-containing protein [Rhodocytophaga aerolata]
METLQLNIEGMGSAHCVMIVKNTISKLPGTEILTIEVGKSQIKYDKGKTSPDQIIGAIEKAGYNAKRA